MHTKRFNTFSRIWVQSCLGQFNVYHQKRKKKVKFYNYDSICWPSKSSCFRHLHNSYKLHKWYAHCTDSSLWKQSFSETGGPVFIIIVKQSYNLTSLRLKMNLTKQKMRTFWKSIAKLPLWNHNIRTQIQKVTLFSKTSLNVRFKYFWYTK